MIKRLYFYSVPVFLLWTREAEAIDQLYPIDGQAD